MAASKGCLELNIPVTVLEDCQRLNDGQKMKLMGSSHKKGAKKGDQVQIFAEKKETLLSFSLHASTMGAVFQRKLNEMWQCDISLREMMEDSEANDIANSTVDSESMLSSPTKPEQGKEPLMDVMKRSSLLSSIKSEVTREEQDDTEGMQKVMEDVDSYLKEVYNETETVTDVVIGDTGNIYTETQTNEQDACDSFNRGEVAVEEITEVKGRKSSRLSSTPRRRYGKGGKEDTPQNKKSKKTPSSPKKTNADTTQTPVNTTKTSNKVRTETSVKKSEKRSESKQTPKKRAAETDEAKPKARKRVKVEVPDCELSELKCEFCERSWFPTVAAYKRHIPACFSNPANQNKDEDGPLKELTTCEICKMTSTQSESSWLRKHMKSVHDIELPPALPWRKDPSKRKQRKTERRERTCEFCGEFVAMWRNKLLFHKRYKCPKNPDVQKANWCVICGTPFATTEALEKHKMTSSCQADVLVCDACGIVFKSRSGLYFHRLKKHGEQKSGKFQCSQCDKSFFTKNHLERHEARHSDDRKYTCELCGKTFKFNHVKRHIETAHQNKYKYYCDKCGHGVEKLSYLKAHICGRVRRNVPPKEKTTTYVTEIPGSGNVYIKSNVRGKVRPIAPAAPQTEEEPNTDVKPDVINEMPVSENVTYLHIPESMTMQTVTIENVQMETGEQVEAVIYDESNIATNIICEITNSMQ